MSDFSSPADQNPAELSAHSAGAMAVDGSESAESCPQACAIHKPMRIASFAVIGSLVAAYAVLAVAPQAVNVLPPELLSMVGLETPTHCTSHAVQAPVLASMVTDDMPLQTFTGETSCAQCEHHIAPLLAPSTLGLALISKDGNIIVVENAHEMYPEIYRDRFNHLAAEVVGKVVRTEGSTLWLEPESLKLVAAAAAP